MSPRACPYSKTVNEFLMFETMAAGMATIEPTPTMIVPFLNKGMRPHLITTKAKEIAFTHPTGDAYHRPDTRQQINITQATPTSGRTLANRQPRSYGRPLRLPLNSLPRFWFLV